MGAKSMRYLVAASGRFVLALLVLVLAVPEISAGQPRTRSGGDSEGGRAIPRTEGPSRTPAPAREPAPTREPTPAPAPAPAAEPSPAPRRTPSAEASGRQTTPRTTGARPREDRPTVGTAVPRGSVPRPPRNDRPVVVPVYYGSYWPWGFGGLGYGSYYGSHYGGYGSSYGGFFDSYSRGY